MEESKGKSRGLGFALLISFVFFVSGWLLIAALAFGQPVSRSLPVALIIGFVGVAIIAAYVLIPPIRKAIDAAFGTGGGER